MSASDIISELPKLTEAERRAVHRKLTELADENEDVAFCNQAALEGAKMLDREEEDARCARLKAFFAEWDATHCVTVGEKPTRERTYAGNPRLR